MGGTCTKLAAILAVLTSAVLSPWPAVAAPCDDTDLVVVREPGTVASWCPSLQPHTLSGSPLARFMTLQSVAHDFDQDGHLDLALPSVEFVHDNEGSISNAVGALLVAYGDGTGTFTEVSTVVDGPASLYVSTGDFDQDGYADLLFPEWGVSPGGSSEARAVILFGGPDRAFRRRANWPIPFDTLQVLAGDVDNDQIEDVVVVHQERETGRQAITTWLSNGAGEFREASTSLGEGGFPAIHPCIDLGDVDGDGVLDIAGIGSDGLGPAWLFVAYGDGAGRFEFQWKPVEVERLPLALEVADFNGDGRSDVAVAFPWKVNASIDQYAETGDSGSLEESTLVHVLYSEDERGWSQHTLDAGVQAILLQAGDLSDDGAADLMVFGHRGSVGIAIGTSEDLPSVLSVYTCRALAPVVTSFIGDFDNDGAVDLGIQGADGVITIRQGDGRGGLEPGWFEPPLDTAVPFGTTLVETAADFDQDGHLDVVLYDDFVGVAIAYGDGTGRFEDVGMVYASRGFAVVDVAVGDYDRDGVPDIAVAHESKTANSDEVWVLHGTGERRVQSPSRPILVEEAGIGSITSAPFYPGGETGLVISPFLDMPYVAFCEETRSFRRGPRFIRPFEEELSIHSLHVIDSNGDGHPDVLGEGWRGPYLDTLAILWLGNEEALFTPAHVFPNIGVYDVGDLDGDGHLDFTGYESATSDLVRYAFFGSESGEFKPVETGRASASRADFNGDGYADGATVLGSLEIVLGNETGGAKAYGTFASQGHPRLGGTTSRVLGDFDEDGWVDVLMINDRYISVALNAFGAGQ